MFDFGFSEMVMIAVVALIVVGPERLPKVARTLGHLWARAQRYINGVRADIARDMAIEELRQLQQKVQLEASSAEQAMKQVTQILDQQVQQLNSAEEQPAQATAQTASAISQQVQRELQATPEQKKFPID